MGTLKGINLPGVIAQDAGVNYLSDMDDKLWVAHERLALLRNSLEAYGLDNDDYVIYTRMRCVKFYCDGCQGDQWKWVLSIINEANDDGKRVVVEAFWHGEVIPSVYIQGKLPKRRESPFMLLDRTLREL